MVGLFALLCTCGYLYYYSNDEFRDSDYVKYTTVHMQGWTDRYGYTESEFWYLAFGYILEPICLISLFLFSSLLFKSKVNVLVKLVVIGGIFSALLYWASFNVHQYTDGILLCGVFCIGKYDADTDSDAGATADDIGKYLILNLAETNIHI